MGPYPFTNGTFEGKAEPLGLEFCSESVHRKVKHLTKQEIEEALQFTVDNYIELIE